MSRGRAGFGEILMAGSIAVVILGLASLVLPAESEGPPRPARYDSATRAKIDSIRERIREICRQTDSLERLVFGEEGEPPSSRDCDSY